MKRVEALMAAPRLSDEEFTKINESVCRGMHVPREQRVAHERAVLERTFGVTLSPEIVELDENGKLIERGKIFSSLRNKCDETMFGALADELTKPGTERRWGKTKIEHLL